MEKKKDGEYYDVAQNKRDRKVGRKKESQRRKEGSQGRKQSKEEKRKEALEFKKG